jgi:hypothetical protein
MPKESEDFADVIEKAQKVGRSGDLGSLFNEQNGPGRTAFEPRVNRAGPDMDFEAHSEVFALPADREAYEDIMNQVMRGEAIMRYEDRTFTKEGDFMVALVYLTPRARPAVVNNQDAGDAEPVAQPRRLP